MKNIKLLLFAALMSAITFNINAQSVNYEITENNVTDLSKLKIRPFVSFSIPPTELVEGLPAVFGVEAQYWTKGIDFRASGSFGTFIGGSLGSTIHFVDKEKTKKNKFVVSRSSNGRTETTTYFKAPVKVYRISGPCADLTAGTFKGAGFYNKLDIGWDFQTYGRAYAKYNNRRIKASGNGWLSMKLQGVLANVNVDMTDYFKLGAGTGKYTEERKMAVGAQINLSAAVSPWRGGTFYVSIPAGYMKYLGVANAPSTTDKGIPILNIILGMQIRL